MKSRALLALACTAFSLTACASTATQDSTPPGPLPAGVDPTTSPTSEQSISVPSSAASPSQGPTSTELQVDLVAAATEEAALQGVVQRGRPSEPMRAGDWATMDFSTDSDGLKVLFGLVDGEWVVVDAGTFEVGCPFVNKSQARELNLLCP